MVAADSADSCAAVRSSMSSSPQSRNRATASGRNGAIRLPDGLPSASHTVRNASNTSVE